MKVAKTLYRTLMLGIVSVSVAHAQFQGLVEAFESDTGYVKPFATLLGTMTNQAWYQSASVPKAFSFYIGVPISLSFLSSKDRSFEYTWVDSGCVLCNQKNGNPNGCLERMKLTRPTVFGTEPAPKGATSQVNLNGDVVWVDSILFSDGIDGLNALPFMPWLAPQIGLSFFHTELKGRITPIPTPVFSLYVPAAGIQHDLASVLPEIPVSLSVAYNMNWIIGSFTPPDSNINGTLNLRGMSLFAGVLAGYRLKAVEFFLEAGWEHSTLNLTGDLTIAAAQASASAQSIKPDMKLAGRNTFRAGLNIAFPIGYMPVLGGSIGAEPAVTVNILGYKYLPEDKDKAGDKEKKKAGDKKKDPGKTESAPSPEVRPEQHQDKGAIENPADQGAPAKDMEGTGEAGEPPAEEMNE